MPYVHIDKSTGTLTVDSKISPEDLDTLLLLGGLGPWECAMVGGGGGGGGAEGFSVGLWGFTGFELNIVSCLAAWSCPCEDSDSGV